MPLNTSSKIAIWLRETLGKLQADSTLVIYKGDRVAQITTLAWARCAIA